MQCVQLLVFVMSHTCIDEGSLLKYSVRQQICCLEQTLYPKFK